MLSNHLILCFFFPLLPSIFPSIRVFSRVGSLHQMAKVLELQLQHQFSSVPQSGPTLFDPMDCSTPGLPVHHQLPKFTQTHAHWVGDVIYPFHALLSPSPLAFSLSQNQGLQMSWFFTSGGQSIGVSTSTSILPMNIQGWFPLGWTGWISLLSKGLSRVFSSTTIWNHQLFSTQPVLSSNSHICGVSQVAVVVNNLPADAGDVRDASLTPALGRSTGGGNDNPLQYSYLENPMDRGAWWATQSIGSQRVGQDWSKLACRPSYICA